MNSYPLGSKENPHPITPSVKDRVKGHYYIYKKLLFYIDIYKFKNIFPPSSPINLPIHGI